MIFIVESYKYEYQNVTMAIGLTMIQPTKHISHPKADL